MTLIDARCPPPPPGAASDMLAASLGFLANAAGLVAWDVCDAVLTPGDLMLLGARSLEGLNLMVDPARKRLVASGPRPAAPLII